MTLPDFLSLPAEADLILEWELFSTVTSLGTLCSNLTNRGLELIGGFLTGIFTPTERGVNNKT